MDDKRRAIRLVGLAVAVLFGGGFFALLLPNVEVEVATAAFIGFVICMGRALAVSHADDLVFESRASRNAERAARSAVRAGLAAGTIGALALGRAAAAPRTRSKRPGARTAFPRALHPTRIPRAD
jgi:predicted RND superfamily exporter protein